MHSLFYDTDKLTPQNFGIQFNPSGPRVQRLHLRTRDTASPRPPRCQRSFTARAPRRGRLAAAGSPHEGAPTTAGHATPAARRAGPHLSGARSPHRGTPRPQRRSRRALRRLGPAPPSPRHLPAAGTSDAGRAVIDVALHCRAAHVHPHYVERGGGAAARLPARHRPPRTDCERPAAARLKTAARPRRGAGSRRPMGAGGGARPRRWRSAARAEA